MKTEMVEPSSGIVFGKWRQRPSEIGEDAGHGLARRSAYRASRTAGQSSSLLAVNERVPSDAK